MIRPAQHSAAATDDRFDDLVEEVTQRLEAGESVDPGQYLHWGTGLVERLGRLLPTLQALASLQSSRGSGPRSARTAIVPPESLAKDLGDFQLGQELGRGGMGIVFAAEQRSLARRVAVKVLPWASLLSEVALDRFRTEARAAASLTHEHIVPVYAVGCERGVHYYAMKLIDGCSLAEVIRERQCSVFSVQCSGGRRQESVADSSIPQSAIGNLQSPSDTLPLAAQITAAVNSESDWYRSIARLGVQAARALAHAHGQGVVHRDIKPSNLLLGKNGRLWLSDFGLARLEADAGLTRTGDLLGTLRYMSPEQALGQSSDLDARADIYSLGATLYECLTLQPAIRASTRTEILRQARDPRIAPLRSHDPHVPEGLERIVLKCLRADPADRYATAAALAEDLERFLQGQNVRAKLPSPYRRVKQWATRHPTAMLVAMAALAVTAAFSLVLAFFLWTADVRLRGPPDARGSPPLASASSPPLDSKNSSESPVMPRAKLSPVKSNKSNQTNRRLFLERLEDRTLLAGFNYADFSVAGNLNVIGDASITADNRLRLTPAEVYQIGGAWSVEKPVVAGNFETTFQFQLHGGSDGSNGGSDGFVMVIQNSGPTELYAPGSALGYDRMPNSVAIEFDTKLDVGQAGDSINDPSTSHISVHTNGTGPNSAIEANSLGSYTTPGFILDDAQVHTAKVSYTPGTLQVFLDNMTTSVLSVPLDLNTKLNLDEGRAWIGFTAATSRASTGYQNHDILNWSFQADDNLILAEKPTVVEGANGSTTTANFTIRRIGSTAGSVTVDWTTANGTAAGGSDFVAASGQVVFLDGESESQTPVAVTVSGDNGEEPLESFKLILSTSTPGYVTASGEAAILNDDTTVSINDDSVIEGNTATRFIDDFVSANSGGLTHARGAVFGPDGNLYVASFYTHEVLRYDGQTGAFLDVFVASRSGGIEGPWPITFGPDGDLYVGGCWSDNVVRYDGSTGELIDEFVSSGSGGLRNAKGLAFDSSGNLYVTSGANVQPFEVLRYHADGTFWNAFVSNGSGGMGDPNGLTFGPDGNLYVTNSNGVHRYNGATGAFIDVFIADGIGGEGQPNFLVFRPDGLVYVTSQFSNEVLRYNAATGAFVDGLVSAGSGGLASPFCLTFDESGYLYVCSSDTSEVLRYGPASQTVFTVGLSAPSALPVTVEYSTSNDTALAGDDYTAITTTMLIFAPGETSKTIVVQTTTNSSVEPNETFNVNLSDAVGAVMTNGTGVGTIIDNDTKFYVVDDAATNRTFEYGSFADGGGAGAAGESYALPTGNAAPRGAASTAAGDKVWVVDNNKIVYVYDSAGNLLGSWTAGSLHPTAQVEGIATDGVDVWIVDAKQDKVYRYSGAASRLSGSQNAASSFSLNSGNKDARDIVWGGSNLWVVNNSSTDKVFKYALNGSLAGSWTITGGGGSPTGITLDPSSPSHLWIVDNATDLVSQYDGATGRTSGSQGASTSFALASGNSNPQGIADPPLTGSPAIPSSSATPVEPQPFFAVDLLVSSADFRSGRDEALRPERKMALSEGWTAPRLELRPLPLDGTKVVDLALARYLRDADELDPTSDDDGAEEDGEPAKLRLAR